MKFRNQTPNQFQNSLSNVNKSFEVMYFFTSDITKMVNNIYRQNFLCYFLIKIRKKINSPHTEYVKKKMQLNRPTSSVMRQIED